MNKKFLSAILFGALMITSTGTFVSCKDYDDDIDQINTELSDLKSQVAALQNKINSGEWVSGVTSTADGIKVTLGNGQSFDIKNGKNGAAGANGAAGKDGVTPKIAVNNDVIQVSYDNGTTWTDLVALADLKGAAAAEPIFTVGEDGHIYVQYGEDAEKKDLGVSTGGIFYVEDGPSIVLHICDEEGEWNDIVLPRTAGITSIQALNITGNTIAAGPAVANVKYTIAAANGKYLDGTEFKKGDVLTTTDSKVVAQINPTLADATLYNFYLTDSEGASAFTIGTAKAYSANGAITRAATVKKGIYELPIQVVAGAKESAITATSAYAIATKDAYGNEILSNYDVKVAATKANTSSLIVPTTAIPVVVGEEYDFVAKGDVTEENLVDVKYYFAEGETADVAAAGATLNGSVIKGTVVGKTVTVSVKCLNHLGAEGTPETFDVTFISKAQTGADSMEWTVNTTTVKDSIEVSAYGWADGAANVQLTYKDSDNATQNAPGIDTGVIKTYTDKYGYKTQYLIFTFNPSTVKTGTFTAEKLYGDGNRSKFTLTVTVKDPAATYDFKPLAAYFNADKTEAIAYGAYANNEITYDLYNLFQVKDADKVNVYFSETVPTKEGKKDNLSYKATPWLDITNVANNVVEWDNASIITVDKAGEYKNAAGDAYVFGGAYYARQISVKYVPFGNENLTPVVYTFNLTVKSEVFEGTLEYVKATYKTVDGAQVFDKYVAGDTKVINGNTVELKLSEILAKDVYAKTYDITSDVRVKEAKAVLFDENAKTYLKITGDWTNGYVIEKAQAATAVQNPQECTIQVQVEDQWGKTKTVNVPVSFVK